MVFAVFLFSTVLWQIDFLEDSPSFQQLYEYTINIQQEDGILHLTGNPDAEGFSSAWFYLDNGMQLKEDNIIEISMRVKGVATRLKYLYRKKGSAVYWGQEIIIEKSTQWQKIILPLQQAKPFYSSNFPFALTPDKTPVIYFFIDNLIPGNFDTEIDYISIIKSDKIREER
ncbi:MAG: hypothetical protein N3A65_01565 [candidate division WOR-3 bacterium]|nr:hypothetical protein [candidate division WOR-3 bacterium]